ncbi:uncharacterized protein BDR25DRAFT_353024 [Lindgomyces ingoldianus]|uniref:Uncharacterized protein n=1 Tax=Lindgomyces ingoldianus TaxID=673940 RepID=A0ACB6R1P4_9PLEO|nr:uncharacterized protein BDR25DRAFT_353024 [Lindgomyces ingoldianus]KAF2472705.1 hypothetical protein BDR25DRAFT_353024 [Lindgomyces ingoldianus]
MTFSRQLYTPLSINSVPRELGAPKSFKPALQTGRYKTPTASTSVCMRNSFCQFLDLVRALRYRNLLGRQTTGTMDLQTSNHIISDVYDAAIVLINTIMCNQVEVGGKSRGLQRNQSEVIRFDWEFSTALRLSLLVQLYNY